AASAAAGDPHGLSDDPDAVVTRPGGGPPGDVTSPGRDAPTWTAYETTAAVLLATRSSAVSGTHSSSERTSDSSGAIAGSSASAAATAVSIAVRQRIPSPVAANRISAASRTGPDWGVG